MYEILRLSALNDCSGLCEILRATPSEWRFGFVWDSSPVGSEWLFGFAWDSSPTALNDSLGLHEILRLRLWMAVRVCVRFFGLCPLNDDLGLYEIHRLRLWMTVWCSGLLCYCLWWCGEGCIKYFRFNCDCLIYNQQKIKNTFFEEVVVEYKTQFTV